MTKMMLKAMIQNRFDCYNADQFVTTKKIEKILLKKIKITSIIILPKQKGRYRHTSFFSRSFHKSSQHKFLSFH